MCDNKLDQVCIACAAAVAPGNKWRLMAAGGIPLMHIEHSLHSLFTP